jgi:hypothetical protein
MVQAKIVRPQGNHLMGTAAMKNQCIAEEIQQEMTTKLA